MIGFFGRGATDRLPKDMFNKGTIAGLFAKGPAGFGSAYFQQQAGEKRKEAIGQARVRLEELQRAQRAQRMADLEKTLSFFQPVQEQMRRLYGG